jgi:hypothetical protein
MKHTFRNSPHAWACSKAHPANTGRKAEHMYTHTNIEAAQAVLKSKSQLKPQGHSPQFPIACVPCKRPRMRPAKETHSHSQSPPKIVALVSANPACCTVKGQRARPARLYSSFVDSSTLVLYIHIPHPHVLCSSVTPQLRQPGCQPA